MKKRTIVMVLGIVLLSLFVAACASKPKEPEKTFGGVPDFVKQAYRSASEDVLIGVGAYKGTDDAARRYATERARVDISRQLKTIVDSMVTDYDARSEQDKKAVVSFQESITRSLSKATLSGSKPEGFDVVDGTTWAIVSYSKSLAARDLELGNAESAARLAAPAAAAFDALTRMDNAFDKAAGGKASVPVTE